MPDVGLELVANLVVLVLEDFAAADSLRDGRLTHVPNAGHHVFDEYDTAYAELWTFLRSL